LYSHEHWFCPLMLSGGFITMNAAEAMCKEKEIC